MGETIAESGSRSRLSVGIKLAAIFVALTVLPMAGISYYIITQAQA